MRKQLGLTSVELTIFVVGLLGVGGWIANIVKLAGEVLWPLTGMMILRVIGIFVPPLGAICGFL